MKYLAGIDIGGTKCAVTIGKEEGTEVEILYKEKFPTQGAPEEVVKKLVDTLERMVSEHPEVTLSAVGVSCGSPLDSEKGIILCPPNLPDWDHIDVVTPFEERFGVPAGVQNDANACALAEWLWGAGKGCKNMVFLTFGTGLGAGLILDGRLYTGTNDMAGEAGHVRLEHDGPEGYGKRGSFEGFCSGGGIARYAVPKVKEWLEAGKTTAILDRGQTPEEVTTQDVGLAAQAGDELGLSILRDTGRMLGKGLAMLMDILNPQKIVIGSIFLRQEKILRSPMEEVIEEEALSYTREVCQVVPAGLGEQLGDYAALSVAGNLLQKGNGK
ncbi:MAG: ROK family protein [Firmicutes bacterium]|nr:ROK family protein [Bacillota bacterium]